MLSPDLDVCWRNPFLSGVSEEDVVSYEAHYAAWWQRRSATMYRQLTHFYYNPNWHPDEPSKDTYAKLTAGRVGDELLPVIYDAQRPWPCPYGPNGEHHVERLHKPGEGASEAKQICGLSKYNELITKQKERWPELFASSAAAAAPDECIVYSLGSNNQFGFEEVLSATTSCSTWTFDCTSSPPTTSIPRLHFEASCLGPEEFQDTGKNLQLRLFPMHNPAAEFKPSSDQFRPILEKVKYTTYYKIVDEKLKHTHVSLLKIDIEGGEYATLIDMLSDPVKSRTLAPFQITIEIHWWTRGIGHAMLTMELLNLLYRNGYRVVSHETQWDPSCFELTWVRAFC